ncbi:MAG TPA: exodeoxyribonuclease VII small subunit [Ignavibacteriaceae bacterium]|nr:exodeoxyribonuclease VII small subunit [Ignavibacteriaceae bacterium]
MSKKSIYNTFDAKLKRLEEISVQLENEETTLEESLQLFEEGVQLSKECQETLNHAELKITELKNNLSDNPHE